MNVINLEEVLVNRSASISNSKGNTPLIEDCKEWVRKSKLMSLHMKQLISSSSDKEK